MTLKSGVASITAPPSRYAPLHAQTLNLNIVKKRKRKLEREKKNMENGKKNVLKYRNIIRLLEDVDFFFLFLSLVQLFLVFTCRWMYLAWISGCPWLWATEYAATCRSFGVIWAGNGKARLSTTGQTFNSMQWAKRLDILGISQKAAEIWSCQSGSLHYLMGGLKAQYHAALFILKL